MSRVIVTISGGIASIFTSSSDLEIDIVDYDSYEPGIDRDDDEKVIELEKEIENMQEIDY